MPRRRRIQIDGVVLHIVQRGHNRGNCFFDDLDRYAYLGWLREALQRNNLSRAPVFSLYKVAFSGAGALATASDGRPCVRPTWA